MAEDYFRCSKCGHGGLCIQNITGERHRVFSAVYPDEAGLTDDQKRLAQQGRLVRLYLCGTWFKQREGEVQVPGVQNPSGV